MGFLDLSSIRAMSESCHTWWHGWPWHGVDMERVESFGVWKLKEARGAKAAPRKSWGRRLRAGPMGSGGSLWRAAPRNPGSPSLSWGRGVRWVLVANGTPESRVATPCLRGRRVSWRAPGCRGPDGARGEAAGHRPPHCALAAQPAAPVRPRGLALPHRRSSGEKRSEGDQEVRMQLMGG